MKFILAVIAGDVVVSNRKRAAIEADLERLGFDRIEVLLHEGADPIAELLDASAWAEVHGLSLSSPPRRRAPGAGEGLVLVRRRCG